mgnify:CR=1 FL=1
MQFHSTNESKFHIDMIGYVLNQGRQGYYYPAGSASKAIFSSAILAVEND